MKWNNRIILETLNDRAKSNSWLGFQSAGSNNNFSKLLVDEKQNH